VALRRSSVRARLAPLNLLARKPWVRRRGSWADLAALLTRRSAMSMRSSALAWSGSPAAMTLTSWSATALSAAMLEVVGVSRQGRGRVLGIGRAQRSFAHREKPSKRWLLRVATPSYVPFYCPWVPQMAPLGWLKGSEASVYAVDVRRLPQRHISRQWRAF
jgi:hypothetical protein